MTEKVKLKDLNKVEKTGFSVCIGLAVLSGLLAGHGMKNGHEKSKEETFSRILYPLTAAAAFYFAGKERVLVQKEIKKHLKDPAKLTSLNKVPKIR